MTDMLHDTQVGSTAIGALVGVLKATGTVEAERDRAVAALWNLV